MLQTLELFKCQRVGQKVLVDSGVREDWDFWVDSITAKGYQTLAEFNQTGELHT